MSYDLSIQPQDPRATAQRSLVEAFIASLSGVRHKSSGEYTYGDRREQLFVHIVTGENDTIDSVELSVPAAFTGSSCEEALLLSFQIAEHLGWRVFDPQVGDYLNKSTASEVLRRQKGYGDTIEGVLRRRSAREANFGEIFGQQFACHNAWILILTLIAAALGAAYLVVQRGVAESRFHWIFFGTALGLHVVRAFVSTIWQRIRNGETSSITKGK